MLRLPWDWRVSWRKVPDQVSDPAKPRICRQIDGDFKRAASIAGRVYCGWIGIQPGSISLDALGRHQDPQLFRCFTRPALPLTELQPRPRRSQT